jgi:hypothetical protein
MASVLAGATYVSNGGTNAYIKVAEDVLGCLAETGLIEIDAEGWYRLTSTSSSKTTEASP